ncbi:CD36 antigen family-containing protein [Aphelenchoides fujianensis]|nr:CD36 antigen family-containing protein [Aphelenchoides fujianensis]
MAAKKACGGFLLVSATIFLIFAIVLLVAFPIAIFKSLVRTQSQLKRDADGQYTKATFYWAEPPAETSYDFYLFDFQNADNLTFFGETPLVQQRGPYAWKTRRGRSTFRPGGVVDYEVHKTWRYTQEESCDGCSYDDEITLPNLSIATMARLLLENAPKLTSTQLLLADLTPLLLGIYPFSTVKMRDVLFIGYTDALLDFLQSDLKKDLDKQFGNLLGFDPPPIPLLGYFAAYNDTTDGQYTAMTGATADVKTGLIQSWRNMTKLPWWKTNETNDLTDTTDGALSGLPFLCRHLVLDFAAKEKVEGIPVYRFDFNPNNFNPYEKQFAGYEFNNTEDVDYFPNWDPTKSGNLTNSLGNHRLRKDSSNRPPPEAVSSINGLAPDPANHSLGSFWIQPTVGSALKADVRSQLNIAVYQNDMITSLKHTKSALVPCFWLHTRVHLRPYAYDFIRKGTVTVPMVAFWTGIGFAAAFGACVLLLLALFCRLRKSNSVSL